MASSNIYDEAIQKLRNEPLNLYNQTSNIIIEDENKDRVFEKIEIPMFDKYYNLLKNNTQELDFQPIYQYKPEYVSYTVYGTPSYDYLILHANKMTSKKQFKREAFLLGKLKFYSQSIIDQIISDYSNKVKKDTTRLPSGNYLLYNI